MKIVICILAATILVSCSSHTIRSYIEKESVYEVVSRNCVGSQQAINSCESILLLELVKGSFYKISDNEMAFVIWSGEKNDLTYSARRLEPIEKVVTGRPIIIFESEGYAETLNLSNLDNLIYQFGTKKNLSSIALRRVIGDDLNSYEKAYPGNN